MWRSWIGEPQIRKMVEEEGGERDKNDQFSAHSLRHSFTTIAVQLGFSADIDVARAVGKKVKGEISQSSYSHDDAVDKAEDSRAMYGRIQAYKATQVFHGREIRRYFKANKSKVIDLTDPEHPPEGFDYGDELETGSGFEVVKD